jgi:hypothetical protein
MFISTSSHNPTCKVHRICGYPVMGMRRCFWVFRWGISYLSGQTLATLDVRFKVGTLRNVVFISEYMELVTRKKVWLLLERSCRWKLLSKNWYTFIRSNQEQLRKVPGRNWTCSRLINAYKFPLDSFHPTTIIQSSEMPTNPGYYCIFYNALLHYLNKVWQSKCQPIRQ